MPERRICPDGAFKRKRLATHSLWMATTCLLKWQVDPLPDRGNWTVTSERAQPQRMDGYIGPLWEGSVNVHRKPPRNRLILGNDWLFEGN